MAGTRASFYDGKTARRHDVWLALTADSQALEISGPSLAQPIRWELARLRALSDHARQERLTLTRHIAAPIETGHDQTGHDQTGHDQTGRDEIGRDETGRDAARLIVDDPAMVAWLHESHPDLFRADLRRGTWRRIGLLSAGALASVALILFVILPAMAGTLARLIPLEREVAFGKTVVAQMERFLGSNALGKLTCTHPEGTAALEAMVTRLTAGTEVGYAVEVQVFRHDMVNAFAAPGGQVVLLEGLLHSAKGPDEVAGVLAHEIAHVESRDATRHALRAAGSAGILSMVLGDFSGGAGIALLADHMLSAAYTREAEAEADRFAFEMLGRAGVSTAGMADFFDALDAEPGFELPAYLATHPATALRAGEARRFARAQAETAPILTEGEWRALRRICRRESADAD